MKSLYIVATPIGNLADITLRAIQTLKDVDLILAEDSRVSKKLLDFHNINNNIQTLHEHNERQLSPKIIKLLETKNIALISDAGTPLINDPGYYLVKELKAKNISVIPIPGASSVLAALSSSGMPTDKFCFLGFIPTKENAKINFINQINLASNTNVCFESPKRIMDTLKLMQNIFDNDREICLAKELTKNFETIINDNVNNIIEFLNSDEKRVQGEFVLIISPNKNTNEKYQQLAKILPILNNELSKTLAAKIAAKITGLNKKECYEKIMQL